jgi:hypothetical protein
VSCIKLATRSRGNNLGTTKQTKKNDTRPEKHGPQANVETEEQARKEEQAEKEAERSMRGKKKNTMRQREHLGMKGNKRRSRPLRQQR